MAKASPMSNPAIAAGRAAAGLAGAAGALGAAATAGAAGLAGAAAATGAAGAELAEGAGALAAGAATAGAAAEGTRIDGPPVGLGGKLMRTVCFFWDASAALGGSGVADGGTGGVFSDIGELFQTLGMTFWSVNVIVHWREVGRRNDRGGKETRTRMDEERLGLAPSPPNLGFMSRSPVLMLLVSVQVIASLLLSALCVVWLFRTRDMGMLAAQSNARMAEVSQVRQGFMALLQDTVAYSEKNPSMKLLLQQLGVRVNVNGAPSAPAPGPSPAASNHR